jgi:type IV secretion system protein VirD4
MVTSVFIAVMVFAIAVALVGGWIQPAGQILRSWSAGLLALHGVIAIVLVQIAFALVFRPGVAVPVVMVTLAVLAILWWSGITREPVGTWWSALREARRSKAGSIRRLADHDIGDFTRRLMDRKKGFIYLGTKLGRWVCAEPEHAVLVLGPPRQGKTTAIVIPTILAASGPVVATSTKEDVLITTASTRQQVGTCWLFDPSGTVMLPPSIAPLRWAPVQACSTWDGAVMIAHNIVATSRPAEGLKDAGHWAERAEALLAPLLHAAALDGLTMRQVMTWVLGQDDESPQDILSHHDAELAAVTLAGVGRSAPNERAGIWSTTAGALAAYRSQAALAVTDEPNFDPLRFVHGSDTIYIAAPSRHQKVTAPLVVALLEEIRSAAYARAAEHERAGAHRTRPVLFLLDEVANIAPLPELPSIVSEGGGQGLIVLACLQDLSQARDRWGERAEGFLSLFGSKVILRGLGDIRTLQAISTLAGEHEVEKIQETRPGRSSWFGNSTKRSKTYLKQREPRLPVDIIASGEKGKAVLFQTGRSWTWIRLTRWYNSLPWMSVVAAARRVQAQPSQPSREPSMQYGD